MDRSATRDEIEVVRWLLLNTAQGDISMLDPACLEGARVFPACSCGCASIDFAPPEETVGSPIVADAYAVWPDGVRTGVMLWARPERICGVEVYDLDGDTLGRFPNVGLLRRWENFLPADETPR